MALKMGEIRVVIPSRGRPECYRAVAITPNPTLCVSEADHPAYEALHPLAHFLVHPNDLVGMGRKRQWILDHVDEEVVFMIDDDVLGLYSLVGHQPRRIEDPQSVMEILWNTAIVAEEAGTILFSFQSTFDMRYFLPFAPFSFAGYCNGHEMGIIGRDLQFDTQSISHEDIDFSLQVLLKHRIIWRDFRFVMKPGKVFKTIGGLGGIRTATNMDQDEQRLKVRWGDQVQINHAKRQQKQHTSVMIRVLR